MTTTDKIATAQTESITFDFDLHHSREKVWRALTDPELLSEWLLPIVDLKLQTGFSFAFKTQPQPGWDGVVNCRILDVEPPRKLTYTWVAGENWLDTVVTFTLTPTPSGTRLSLVHSGFKADQKTNVAGARYGWNMMTGKLVDLLARTA